VGPRAGLDTEARGRILSPLLRIEPRSPGRPARSQTLYCLSYPAHSRKTVHGEISQRAVVFIKIHVYIFPALTREHFQNIKNSLLINVSLLG
jgi:hypothetical protein